MINLKTPEAQERLVREFTPYEDDKERLDLLAGLTVVAANHLDGTEHDDLESVLKLANHMMTLPEVAGELAVNESYFARCERDERGRCSGGGGAISKEAKTAPPPGNAYVPDVEADIDGDGVTEYSRVGVPAKEVPPPPGMNRLPNLTEHERAVEGEFIEAFEKNPDGLASDFRSMVVAAAAAKGKPPTFGTDDAKDLHRAWKSDELSQEERSQNRATLNLALHQTANAVCKRAFVQHLDTMKPGEEIMVTVGGCGAGKGYAINSKDADGNPNVPQAAAIADRSAVIWDSAGDQNATENPWIQQEAERRGLKVNYVYVHADPENQWAHPERGVVKRAQDPRDGRMVDAQVFADSYAIGARNHQSFYERNRDNPNARFTFVQNGSPPKLLDGIPSEALSIDRRALARFATKTVKEREGIPPHIVRGATMGGRIWGGNT